MSKSIGENIKAIRKLLGLTQTEVAEKLYTTPQNISRVENGEGEPTAEMLIGLSDVLGVSVDALVGKEELSEKELMSKVQTYFKNADNNEVSNRVFNICKNIIHGRYHKFFEEVNEETETYSTICRSTLSGAFSDRADRPRIFVAVESSTVSLGDQSVEKLIEVFDALSNPLIIPLINKISATQNSESMTYDKISFCSKFSIDEKDFNVVISSLSLLNLVSVKDVMLNDNSITVFCPNMNPKIVMLLTLADMLYNATPDGNIH